MSLTPEEHLRLRIEYFSSDLNKSWADYTEIDNYAPFERTPSLILRCEEIDRLKEEHDDEERRKYTEQKKKKSRPVDKKDIPCAKGDECKFNKFGRCGFFHEKEGEKIKCKSGKNCKFNKLGTCLYLH